MKFSNLFSSGMVFSKGLPIRVFGTGNGSATITFAGITNNVAGKNNVWFTEFPPMDYGGPYTLKLSYGENSIVFDDIFIGEVYLFAGQSNMQFKVAEGKDDLNLCESNDKLRIFTCEHFEKNEFFTPKNGWVKADKETAKYCSALAHFTGITLAKQKNVAIGIIVAYQGASVIESWIPKGMLQENGIYIPEEEKGQSHFNAPSASWNIDGTLYDLTVKQIIPFSLNAVVWYQGESDTTVSEAKIYGKELTILINAWRTSFINMQLPFVIIQLPDYIKANQEAWKMVQQAQNDVQFELQNVKTVISADVCESIDIHPSKKYELAQRLSTALIEIFN